MIIFIVALSDVVKMLSVTVKDTLVHSLSCVILQNALFIYCDCLHPPGTRPHLMTLIKIQLHNSLTL